MTDQTIELLTNSGVWAFAVFLYYFAGKKRGFADGYEKGVETGHKHVLAVMSATGDLIQENKP